MLNDKITILSLTFAISAQLVDVEAHAADLCHFVDVQSIVRSFHKNDDYRLSDFDIDKKINLIANSIGENIRKREVDIYESNMSIDDLFADTGFLISGNPCTSDISVAYYPNYGLDIQFPVGGTADNFSKLYFTQHPNVDPRKVAFSQYTVMMFFKKETLEFQSICVSRQNLNFNITKHRRMCIDIKR